MCTKVENQSERSAERKAARMLMMDFVANNPGEIVDAIEDLIPFLGSICDLSSIKSSMNVVNVTFASVALDVIKSASNGDDGERQLLPVDADQMQFAIYYLERFIRMMEPMDRFIRKNKGTPAFTMYKKAFEKFETR